MSAGLWDDKRFDCGCYAKQRPVDDGKWQTHLTPCESHQKDDAFVFVLYLLLDPYKARLEMLRQRYEYDHPAVIPAQQPEI